jgi:hypothetical protein
MPSMQGGHRVPLAGWPVAQWVQVTVFGAVAMLLTLAGHLVGHGDPPAWPALVLVAVGSAALRSVIGRAVRSTVAMFGALLAAQVLGHLTFLVLSPVTSGAIVGHHGSILLPTLDASGGPVLGGDTWMWLAHTVAAGLVAVWLFRGESLSEALARRLVAMVRRLPRFAPVEVGHGRPSQPEAPMVRGRHTVLFDAPRRGPPVRPRTHALALIAPRRHGSPSSDCTRTMPSTPAQRRRKDPLSRPHLKPSDCSVLNSHGMPPRCDKTGGIPLSRTSGSTAWGARVSLFWMSGFGYGGPRIGL